MNSSVYAALPGVETPVAEVPQALAAMWDMEPESVRGRAAPSEFRASQMNLVLHFGLDSTPEQARAGFDVALGFSRRYPCRIIALCPRAPGEDGGLAAKVFAECFIGSSRHDMTCTEAIALTYPLTERVYVQDQASILLESDLPVYYWPQRISLAGRLQDYPLFLREAQRIVIDSAVEKPEVRDFAWPRPEAVHDLALARTLPVRQSMGHFLSYVAPARLVQGLQQVELRHRPAFAAEAHALVQWTRRGLAGCLQASDTAAAAAAAEVREAEDGSLPGSLRIRWSYADGGQVAFDFDFASGAAVLDCTLGCECNRVGATVRLLAPESALGEALFF